MTSLVAINKPNLISNLSNLSSIPNLTVKVLNRCENTLNLRNSSSSAQRSVKMNQAEVSKLVSQLKIRVNPRLRKFRNSKGPEGRLDKLRKTVTALIKHERIELNYPRANEARMYAERLISDAIRYGDCHKTTMEMADFWLIEKQLVHKLFKVMVPRFENYSISYTRLLNAPRSAPDLNYRKAVLELRGNPYPPLTPDTSSNRNLIHNVLLDEAKKAYRARKYAEIAAKIDDAEAKMGLNECATKNEEESEKINENVGEKIETLENSEGGHKTKE